VLTEPVGVWLANAVVNATEPPVLAEPVTTRNAELSPVDEFLVHPVGAVVCANNITVPESNAAAAAEVQIVPFDVRTLPAVPGAGTPEVCNVESGKVIPAVPLSVIGILGSYFCL
jgi:hypothetical protein